MKKGSDIFYTEMCTWGDIVPLNFMLNVDNLLDEISEFKFEHFNSQKPNNPRYGLSITQNVDIEGVNLESLFEYNRVADTSYTESDFRDRAPVWYNSNQVRSITSPYIDHLGRSHVLKLDPGGHFPPHRDPVHSDYGRNCFRVIVPLQGCNPPSLYFHVDDKIQHWEHGRAYFFNTNKMHHLFSYHGSLMIVMNVLINEYTFKMTAENIRDL